MISVESLREARTSYAVVLHSIIQEYQNNKFQLFFLIEGKDADYFRPRVSAIFSDNDIKITYKNMKGKNNLKKLFKSIQGNDNINKSSVLAFYDRDYEQDIAEISQGRTFITDGYSIENYYTDANSFESIIKSIIFSDAVNTEEEKGIVLQLCESYKRSQKEFHGIVSLFNCWAWCQRHMRSHGQINLDDFSLTSHVIFDADKGSLLQKYDLSDLNALCPERQPITPGEISIAEEWFAKKEPRMAFRGKQEIDFLYKFYCYISNKCVKGVEPFKSPIKIRRNVSRKDVVYDLSIYAHTPKELNEFLIAARSDFCSAE